MLRVPQDLRATGREGWRVTHKKIERLYRKEGLLLRRRVRKNHGRPPRCAAAAQRARALLRNGFSP